MTPKADTLTAYATLGGELFDDFFRKYEMKLSLEVGPKARNQVAGACANSRSSAATDPVQAVMRATRDPGGVEAPMVARSP